jgi:mucin-2
MLHRPRRQVATLATAALVLTGSMSSIASADDSFPVRAPEAPAQLLGGLLDGLLTGILGNVLGQTIGQLQATLSGLTSTQIGDLLTAANPAQLTKLLSALTTPQLSGALGTLTPTETGDMLALADTSQLNTLLGGLTAPQLTSAAGTLTAAETGAILAPLSGTNLTSVLSVLNVTQLTNGLGTLSAGQTGGLLAVADPTQLTTLLGVLSNAQLAGGLGTLGAGDVTDIVGTLSPAQITGLLAGGGTGSAITGLLGSATGLAAGTPSAGAVDGLVGQVTALLGGGLPVSPGQLTDLGSLTTTVRSLLGTAGLDPNLLTGLLTTVNSVLASSPLGAATQPLQDLVGTISALLAPASGGDGGSTPPGTTTPGTTTPGTTNPATTTTGTTTTTTTAKSPAAGGTTSPAANAGFTAYRASISTIKVAKKRTSAKFTISCPMSAPKGCLVKVSGTVAGQKAIPSLTLALPRGASAPVTVKLNKSTAKRLRKKGGSLRFSAQTALSTLPTASQIVKVKRPKQKR